MAQGKKSFLLYADYKATVAKVPDDIAGRIFKLILDYVNDLDPDLSNEDILIQVIFEPIRQQLKRDLKVWEEKRATRSELGKKGMEKRWSGHNKAITNDSLVTNPITKITVTDDVTVTDTVIVTDNVKREKRFTPPTQDEVFNELIKTFDDFTSMAEAEKFIDYYTSNGWKVGRNPMKNWKSAVRNWVRNSQKFTKNGTEKSKPGTSEARIEALRKW